MKHCLCCLTESPYNLSYPQYVDMAVRKKIDNGRYTQWLYNGTTSVQIPQQEPLHQPDIPIYETDLSTENSFTVIFQSLPQSC